MKLAKRISYALPRISSNELMVPPISRSINSLELGKYLYNFNKYFVYKVRIDINLEISRWPKIVMYVTTVKGFYDGIIC